MNRLTAFAASAALLLAPAALAAEGDMGIWKASCKLPDGKNGWQVQTPTATECVEAASGSVCHLRDGRKARLITRGGGLSFCRVETEPPPPAQVTNKCEGGQWKRGADGGMNCELAAKPVLVDPKSGRLGVIKEAAKPGDKCTAKDGRPGIWLRGADGKLMRCKPSR